MYVCVFLKQHKSKQKTKPIEVCGCQAQRQPQETQGGLFYSHFIQTYSQAVQTELKRAEGENTLKCSFWGCFILTKALILWLGKV